MTPDLKIHNKRLTDADSMNVLMVLAEQDNIKRRSQTTMANIYNRRTKS